MSTPNLPGWYPDPERPGRERLWDGQAWTDHLRRTADQGRISPRTIMVSVAGLVVLLLVWVAAASGDDGVTADPATSQPPATTPSQQTPTTAATPTSEPTPTQPPSPTLARVPDVEGLALTKAKRALGTAKLKVGKVDRRPSSKRKDTVLKQGVAEGTEVKPGSRVSLVVAAPLPRVPSVVGQPEGSAIRDLKNAGFEVKKTMQTRSTGQDGVVLSQSPSGGTRAKPKSVVRIVILNVEAPPEAPPDSDSTGNCTPGYSPCLPPASDYDCAGGSGNGPEYADGPIRITGSDPYDLDRNGDGIGCED